MMATPRYPELTVSLHSRNSLALVAAVRLALRRAGVGAEEVRRFSQQALANDAASERLRVCQAWVEIKSSAAAG